MTEDGSAAGLPIPTALGWWLCESVVKGSLIGFLAATAAVGAGALEHPCLATEERVRRSLNYYRYGREPEPETASGMLELVRQGGRARLLEREKLDPAALDDLETRLDAAVGPFGAMAAGFIPAEPNAAQRNLADFSHDADQLGVRFAGAVTAGDIEGAKNVLLGSNWIGPAHWSFSEDGGEEAARNAEAARAAESWQDLARAAAPVAVNLFLAWLSRLDVAAHWEWRAAEPAIPLFLPLIPTPGAKGGKLPVPRLIRMLTHLSREVSRRRRAESGKREIRMGKEQAPDQEKLNALRKYDLLPREKFDELLEVLKPGAAAAEGEEPGFDLHALLIAVNAISLLVPRGGLPPKKTFRKKTAGQATPFAEISPRYMFWWRQSLQEMARCEAPPNTWPKWFVRSMGA